MSVLFCACVRAWSNHYDSVLQVVWSAGFAGWTVVHSSFPAMGYPSLRLKVQDDLSCLSIHPFVCIYVYLSVHLFRHPVCPHVHTETHWRRSSTCCASPLTRKLITSSVSWPDGQRPMLSPLMTWSDNCHGDKSTPLSQVLEITLERLATPSWFWNFGKFKLFLCILLISTHTT